MKASAKVMKLPTINPSGIHPIEYKVLIRPVKVEERTAGGIIRPETVKEKDQHAAMEGEIIAVSPFAFSYEDWPAGAEKPHPGQTAIFARYSGVTIKGKDGEEYRLMNDKDVVAVKE
jgi:chaperonin GroES